ncbi:ORF-102 [Teiidae poxvirus 1]|nr:ORF-102 [Teiidae poxvirus 1]
MRTSKLTKSIFANTELAVSFFWFKITLNNAIIFVPLSTTRLSCSIRLSNIKSVFVFIVFLPVCITVSPPSSADSKYNSKCMHVVSFMNTDTKSVCLEKKSSFSYITKVTLFSIKISPMRTCKSLRITSLSSDINSSFKISLTIICLDLRSIRLRVSIPLETSNIFDCSTLSFTSFKLILLRRSILIFSKQFLEKICTVTHPLASM